MRGGSRRIRTSLDCVTGPPGPSAIRCTRVSSVGRKTACPSGRASSCRSRPSSLVTTTRSALSTRQLTRTGSPGSIRAGNTSKCSTKIASCAAVCTSTTVATRPPGPLAVSSRRVVATTSRSIVPSAPTSSAGLKPTVSSTRSASRVRQETCTRPGGATEDGVALNATIVGTTGPYEKSGVGQAVANELSPSAARRRCKFACTSVFMGLESAPWVAWGGRRSPGPSRRSRSADRPRSRVGA